MKGMRITVGPDGTPWIVTQEHRIYRRVHGSWQEFPGRATAVAVGPEGSVWALGAPDTAQTGGYPILHWNGRGWDRVIGAAVRIAVDPAGSPWVVNSLNTLFHWTGDQWQKFSGDFTDVAVGPEGSVWALGAPPDGLHGGYPILHWNGRGWDRVIGAAVRIAVDPAGRPWVVNSLNALYRWTGTDWQELPGQATEVAVGADGSVWVIGTPEGLPGNGRPVLTWDGSTLVRADGRVAQAGGNRQPATAPLPGSRWSEVHGRVQEIIIGADGSASVVFQGGNQMTLGGGGPIAISVKVHPELTIDINVNRMSGGGGK